MDFMHSSHIAGNSAKILVFFCIAFLCSSGTAGAYNLTCKLKDPDNVTVYSSISLGWTKWEHGGGTCTSCSNCDKNDNQGTVTRGCTIDCFVGTQLKPECCQKEGQYTFAAVTYDTGVSTCDGDPPTGGGITCTQGSFFTQITDDLEYARTGIVGGYQTPRCACDTRTLELDCPDHFPASFADPATCYDHYFIWGHTLSREFTKGNVTDTGCKTDSIFVSWDKYQEHCACKVGTYDVWGLGCSAGDCASGGLCPGGNCIGNYIDCCGDDAPGSPEFAIECADNCPSSDPECFCGALATESAKWACCATGTDCVYNNRCYLNGAFQSATSQWECNSGTWEDVVGPSASISVTDSNPTGRFYSSGTNNYTGVASVKLTVSATDSGSGIKECRFYQQGTTPPAWSSTSCSGAKTLDLTVGDGAKTIVFQAKDNLGNVNSATDTVILDTAGPGAPVRSPLSRNWDDTNVVVTVTYSDSSGIAQTNYCWTTATPACTPSTSFTNGGTITQTASGAWKLCTSAVDNVGNSGGPHCSPQGAYKIDKIDPTTSIVSPAAHSSHSVDFSVLFADADTGGSGVNPSKCKYRIYDDGTLTKGWTSRTCSGSITVDVGVDCSTDGLDTCRVQARCTDKVGNTGSIASRYFSIDTGYPTCSLDSITELTSMQYQHVSGATVYYSTATGGTFSVRVNANDASGINRVNFPNTVSGGGDDSTSPYEWNYAWDSSDSYDGSATVTCYDNEGLSASTTFTVDRDITPPAGGSMDYPDGFWNLPTVQVGFGTVSDSESGINTSTAALYRREKSLSGGSCTGVWSVWGTPIATGPSVAPPNTYYNDNTVANGKCYQYMYRIYDNVLNQGTYTSTNVTKVDLNPPAGPATIDEGSYSSDPTLVFTYVPPSDPESGLGDCYMQIDNVADFSSPMKPFEGWIGTTGSYTWAGGVDGNTYYARIRCRDNAGNVGSYGTPSDGITVDIGGLEILVANAIDPTKVSNDSVFVTASTELTGVYYEASDAGGGIADEEYSLHEVVIDSPDVVIIDWTSLGIGPAGSFVARRVELNLSQEVPPIALENGKSYYYRIRITDSASNTVSNTSNIFSISTCEGASCGKGCDEDGAEGVCDGNDVCYVGGGCNLTCDFHLAPPGGERVCFDLANNRIDCTVFSALCGRSGATKCGDTSVCEDSISMGDCVDPVLGSGEVCRVVTGGWTAYEPPAGSEFYSLNKPFNITLKGVFSNLDEPLLECVVETPGATPDFYFNKWGDGDAVLVFNSGAFPSNSDGVWNLTRCSLKSDFDENMGWEIGYNGTKYSFKVDTTAPSVWITDPPDGSSVGMRFDVAWNGTDPEINSISSGIKHYDFQYVESSDLAECASTGCVDVCWGEDLCKGGKVIGTSNKQAQVDISNPGTYCFRVRAHDNADNVGEWSCDPGDTGDISACNCGTLDSEPPKDAPSTWIKSYPQYTNNFPPLWFNVNWSAVDDGCGVRGYVVQYKIIDNKTGVLLQNWTNWTEINNLFNVPVRGSYFLVNCTNLTGAAFNPNMVGSITLLPKDDENRTYYFRVRAVDNAYGYANIGSWAVSANGTWIDRTLPFVNSDGIRNLDGSPIPEGGTIMTGERVTLKVEGDPDKTDFSGVNESWIVYNVTSTAGSVEEGVVPCGGEADKCEVVIGPWSDDYDVSYQGFARDRAGNLGWSALNSFLVRGPLALITTMRELYLTLGSYEYVRIDVANRQSVNEEISLSIQPDYPWSKFVDVPGGEFSHDKRIVNITLSPMETKPVMILVYTADIGSWDMTIYANSTILPQHENITGSVKMKIKVVFPAEFSGLSWPAVFLLFLLAGLAYLRFGTARG